MSERISAVNLDEVIKENEVIEKQMMQSESAWTRETDGIDYKQSRSSVFICMAVIPSPEIMLLLLGKYEFWTYFSKILFSLYTEIKYEISRLFHLVFFYFSEFSLSCTLFLALRRRSSSSAA